MKQKFLIFFSVPFLLAMTPRMHHTQNQTEAKKQLREVDEQMRTLLIQAKKTRAERDALEERAGEERDRAKALALEKESEQKGVELEVILDQLENLIEKQNFIENELGRPEDYADSPYQP